MDVAVVLALLAVVVLVGSTLVTYHERLPSWLRRLFEGHLVIIIFGVVAGPELFGVVTPKVIEQLAPVANIALGWVGFLYGTHLERPKLRRYDRHLYGFVFLQATLAFFLVLAAIGVWLALGTTPEVSTTDRVAAAITLAAAASATTPAVIFLIAQRTRRSGPNLELLQLTSVLDDLPALAALALLYAFGHRYGDASTAVAGWQWLALELLLGAGLAVMLRWTLRPRMRERDFEVVLFGIIALAGGLCAFLRLSPLVMGTIAGVVFVNMSGFKERVYAIVSAREHALYLILLILVAVQASLPTPLAWALAGVYIATRFGAKLVGARLARRALLAADQKDIGRGIGFGLLGQGGMAVAMVLAYQRSYPSSLSPWVLGVVLASVVVAELFAPGFATRQLRKEHEA